MLKECIHTLLFSTESSVILQSKTNSMKTILQKIGMLMAVLLCALSAYAYDFEVDGIFYHIVSLEDLTCEVTHGGSYWKKYKGDINIPETVTYNDNEFSVVAIGNFTFENCDDVTSVSIPNSVTSIGESAFWSCDLLTSIVIPNSVISIGASAFSECRSLVVMDIGENVMSIGDYAFKECTSLSSVTIPNSVTKIGESVFQKCQSLVNIKIGDSVTSIGKNAFNKCSSLTNISLGESITTIGERAFEDCKALTTIIIPQSVTTVNPYWILRTAKMDKVSADMLYEKSIQLMCSENEEGNFT